MRGTCLAGAIVIFLLLAVLTSRAASNLNLSKSNINRLIYPADTVSSAQAAAILADLDAATQQSQGRINLEGAVKDRKSTRLNSSHIQKSRMPSSA